MLLLYTGCGVAVGPAQHSFLSGDRRQSCRAVPIKELTRAELFVIYSRHCVGQPLP